MDIRLFISKTGEIALTCHDGAFATPIAGVELDMLTTMLSVRLKDSEELIELNCPVDYNSIDLMLDQQICTVGFYLQNRLAGAMFVPFQVINKPYSFGGVVQ
jgi:hypothetical protein